MGSLKKKIIPVTPVPLFYDPARDGVTFSLLSTFLTCREKARLYLKGYSGEYSTFAMVFGTITHRILQRAYTLHRQGKLKRTPDKKLIIAWLDEIHALWQREHPAPHPKAVEIFEEAMMKAGAIMPLYFIYWAKDDFVRHHFLAVEETFRLPWTVTTRKGQALQTFLRGRMDGAFIIPGGRRHADAPRLLETKTRSQVDETNLEDTMPHERQTNTYLSALWKKTGVQPRSVLLNVIRKPALRQKQKETYQQFVARIEADVRSRMDWYFIRMEMVVEKQDIHRAEGELNDLIADFLLWWAGESGHYKDTNQCITPGYGRCPYLGICGRNDFHGVVKRDVVFRELEEE